ncbi:hypothetical protein GCM10007071_37270 [Marinobacter zhanjiangensis]|uniref:Uncharacterized protein n=1 Tax=Marinobacter zhanjiangensis TaxID=578215 RepID=A0ABQ3BAU8_9GAMM|nr:hypothetical protein GCM10007071_37270 [Marinobacter zhanjiangensis]
MLDYITPRQLTCASSHHKSPIATEVTKDLSSFDEIQRQSTEAIHNHFNDTPDNA